ncbi:UrcA family protein [Sphingomonas sp. G-3-2-10]|uniref:UrcA family protein n=1 Tax=Sphingomonas sp. G-3-2-10 TaxID=2728838 RepID=UPI001F1093BC|nr:UrcA family protein [Sphingomonas sp. G-3-2-10]
MITTLISPLILGAMLAVATPVQDVPAPGVSPSVSIAYADLNLTHAAGIAEFDRRIERAVDAVCPAPKIKSLADLQAVESCRAAALNRASAQREKALASARINNETLASVR